MKGFVRKEFTEKSFLNSEKKFSNYCFSTRTFRRKVTSNNRSNYQFFWWFHVLQFWRPALYRAHPMKTVPGFCQMFTYLKYHAASMQFHEEKLSAAVSRSNYWS